MIEIVHILVYDVRWNKLRRVSRAGFLWGENLTRSSHGCHRGWGEPALACRSPFPEGKVMCWWVVFHVSVSHIMCGWGIKQRSFTSGSRTPSSSRVGRSSWWKPSKWRKQGIRLRGTRLGLRGKDGQRMHQGVVPAQYRARSQIPWLHTWS